MKKGFWYSVRDSVKKADIILQVLDARMPNLTRIRKMEHFIKSAHKPCILVINKADLISRQTIKSIRERYASTDFVLVSTKRRTGLNDLMNIIKSKVNPKEDEKAKVLIIGYPNTGKSSLINVLSRKSRAKTSSESGYTKGLQWIAGKRGFKLMDTPGVVPFSQRDEIRLGLVSGISPAKLKDPEVVAFELIKIFQQNNPKELEKLGLDPDLDVDEILEDFGKLRNMIRKGGVVDEKRAAVKLLREWHDGKIRI